MELESQIQQAELAFIALITQRDQLQLTEFCGRCLDIIKPFEEISAFTTPDDIFYRIYGLQCKMLAEIK